MNKAAAPNPDSIHKSLSPFSPLIEQAIELAAQWHDITYRKSRWREAPFEIPEGEVLRVPAMAHAAAVALIVQRAGWGDAVVAAAFLHDVLEDANRYGQILRFEQLREGVGEEVARIVLILTEQKLDASGVPRSWRDRKRDYVSHLAAAPPGAVAVSLADKLHNLWTINQALERGIDVFRSGTGRKGLSAGPEEQLWFHRAVLDASSAHEEGRLAPLRKQLEEEIERFVQISGLNSPF